MRTRVPSLAAGGSYARLSRMSSRAVDVGINHLRGGTSVPLAPADAKPSPRGGTRLLCGRCSRKRICFEKRCSALPASSGKTVARPESDPRKKRVAIAKQRIEAAVPSPTSDLAHKPGIDVNVK